MLLTEIISFMFIGAFTGIAAGLLGVGGGLIIVPFSLIVFETLAENNSILIPYYYQAHVAIATSLATIIFTSLSSIYSQQKKDAIDWSIFWLLAPGNFYWRFSWGMGSNLYSKNAFVVCLCELYSFSECQNVVWLVINRTKVRIFVKSQYRWRK